tara:strand:+ start:1734 stop:2930 length:1197 start_codon:yes stop_codon:yes gene_type:complete
MALTKVKGSSGELGAGHGSSDNVVYRAGINYESAGASSSVEGRAFYHDYRPLISDGADYNTDGVNMFFGFGAGNFTMAPDSGAIGTYNLHTSHNIGFGAQALGQLTTGYKNTAIGTNALRYNTQGYGNSALGRDASHNLTTGFENTSSGFTALFGVTTGNYNVGVGSGSGYNNLAGHGNVSVGRRAAYNRTTGNYNTTLGHLAGTGHTAGGYNTHIGHQASNNGITTANYTTLVGSRFSGLPNSDNLVVLGDGEGNEVLRVDLDGTGKSKLDIVAKDSTAYNLSSATAQIDSGSTILMRSITNVGNALVQFVAQSRVGQMYSRWVYWGGVTQNVSLIQDTTEVVRWNSVGDIQQRVNSSAAALGINQTMTFELVSNTSLKIKVRGTDGTTRSVALTLA